MLLSGQVRDLDGADTVFSSRVRSGTVDELDRRFYKWSVTCDINDFYLEIDSA